MAEHGIKSPTSRILTGNPDTNTIVSPAGLPRTSTDISGSLCLVEGLAQVGWRWSQSLRVLAPYELEPTCRVILRQNDQIAACVVVALLPSLATDLGRRPCYVSLGFQTILLTLHENVLACSRPG